MLDQTFQQPKSTTDTHLLQGGCITQPPVTTEQRALHMFGQCEGKQVVHAWMNVAFTKAISLFNNLGGKLHDLKTVAGQFRMVLDQFFQKQNVRHCEGFR